MKHFTVLKKEAIDFLNVKEFGIYLDGTFGAGGHSEEILSRCENVKLICVDRDESTKIYFDKLKEKYKKAELFYANEKFSNIDLILLNLGLKYIDGAIFDFGLSSMQIDQRDRGFSFQNDSKLSMEMGLNEKNAFDVVNYTPEDELANIIYGYGDEKKSRQIAKEIAKYREIKEIETTLELSEIIKKAVKYYNDTINPATRTFQAIRIFVNNELNEIEIMLNKIQNISKNGTKYSCISFHSLEDSLVKNFIKNNDIDRNFSNFDKNYGISFKNKINNAPFIRKLHKKTIIPSIEEIKLNIRSRSARMRCFEIIFNN